MQQGEGDVRVTSLTVYHLRIPLYWGEPPMVSHAAFKAILHQKCGAKWLHHNAEDGPIS